MTGHQSASVLLAPLTSRRTFLKFSMLGCAVGAATLNLTGCATPGHQIRTTDQAESALNAEELAFFDAVAPVILGLQAEETTGDLSSTISQGIGQFGPVNQAQFSQLLSLLTFSATRVTIAGVWSDWPTASRDSIDEFLNDWRNSPLGLLNAGYGAITKITASVYYGLPQNHQKSGYPGPPDYALKALPQFRQESQA